MICQCTTAYIPGDLTVFRWGTLTTTVERVVRNASPSLNQALVTVSAGLSDGIQRVTRRKDGPDLNQP